MRPGWVLESAYYTLENTARTHLPYDVRGWSLSGVQERVLQPGQAMVSVALRSGPHHPEVPMILEVWVLGQDVRWNL